MEEQVQSESQVIHPLEVLVLNKTKTGLGQLLLLSAHLVTFSRKIRKKSDLKLYFYEDEVVIAAGVSNSDENFTSINSAGEPVELDKTKLIVSDYKGPILDKLKEVHKSVKKEKVNA